MQTLSVPEDSEADMDDDTQALLTSDFELGHYIRERIVPRAVLYYTGNAREYYYKFPIASMMNTVQHSY